jgi:hypothetical protein
MEKQTGYGEAHPYSALRKLMQENYKLETSLCYKSKTLSQNKITTK